MLTQTYFMFHVHTLLKAMGETYQCWHGPRKPFLTTVEKSVVFIFVALIHSHMQGAAFSHFSPFKYNLHFDNINVEVSAFDKATLSNG